MLLRHFHLREQPFGVTPDPRFLFSTATHREALAALLYGIESGLGFIALTASPGMGKTTLVFETLSRLKDSARTVFLFQAITSPLELVRALLIDLGEKEPQGTMVDLETKLNEILVTQSEAGKRLVVILDEAQNLDAPVLEAVRMLSNFETASHKLLQIVLCGQLQLAGRLAEPGLLQLRQRISIFASLQPLSLFETADYIQHRLKIAGYTSDRPPFTPQALTSIARHSGGVPRNINNLCFNSLSLACALKKTAVDAEVVSEVICDLDLRRETAEDNIAMSGFEKPLREQSLLARWQPSRPALRVAGIAMVISAIASAVGWTYLANMGLVRAGIPGTPAGVHSAATQAATLHGKFDSAAAPLPAVSHAAERPLLRVVPVASLVAPAKPSPHSQDPAGATDGSEASTMVEDELRLVEARSGQTVAGICVEQYGGCSPHLLRRIIELNPRIADPDHIEQGQRIVLPAAEAAPYGTKRPPDSD